MNVAIPARVERVTGSLVEAAPLPDVALFELVRVGEAGLLAEVVRLAGERATLQVYEETAGLEVGESVVATGRPLEARLGPGLLGAVLDGIGRPLARLPGDFLLPGTSAPMLPTEVRWRFTPVAAAGQEVEPGDLLGTVVEGGFEHQILVPPGVRGRLAVLSAGEFTVEETIGRLEGGLPLALSQGWPVRRPRPIGRRLPHDRPLVTGQRVFDFLFPAAEGGSVAVPGGFGTGKTVIEQSLAKYAAADMVVYVGCGERGNEMAEVLADFPRLVDPKTGRSVMERTVLIVNTSNMPVVARESSIELGLTVAEYFRDQGLSVAVMVDSLSRWAEALREIAGRLGELPGEEGYPTHLGSRLGRVYERAGRAEILGRPRRVGAVTLVAAISPPGGDFSEPVTQGSLAVVGALWALDAGLARQRQFPAVDWQLSFSLYTAPTQAWFERQVGTDWPALRTEILTLLSREAELAEIAGLVGAEALQEADRFTLEVARLAREHLLGQSATAPHDATSSLDKTHRLARAIHHLAAAVREALAAGLGPDSCDLGQVARALAALRLAPETELDLRERQLEEALLGLAPGRSR